jgi:hypothetical protein
VFTANSPYDERASKLPDTTDATDSIYGTDGASLLLAPVADGSGGYAADFSVGISAGIGGSSGSASRGSGQSVRAVLKSVAMIRTGRGTRRLRLKIRTKERIAVTARLKRGRRTVAVERAHLAAGTRTVGVTIPSSTRAGAARLRLRFTDAAGNTKHYSRTVHIHARRS